MPRKYWYKTEYKERNPNVKYRKCQECKGIFHVGKMETSYNCKTCYTKINNRKRCSSCRLMKITSEFHRLKSSKDGYSLACKDCIKEREKGYKKGKGKKRGKYKKWSSKKNREKYHNVKRRCRVQKATLSGFESELRDIYDKCPDGYVVDHIYPIVHPDLCGLHVPWNLQYLTFRENISKSNKLPEELNQINNNNNL